MTHIKVVLISCLLFFGSLPLCQGQEKADSLSMSNSKHFERGYYNYSSNFKGLKYMMNDIYNEDEELYYKLEPAYKSLRRQRNTGSFIGFAGFLAGTYFAIGSFSYLQDDNNINFGALGIGGGIYLASGLISAWIKPNDKDINRFIDLHNKYCEDNKIEWKFSLRALPNQPAEIGIQITF